MPRPDDRIVPEMPADRAARRFATPESDPARRSAGSIEAETQETSPTKNPPEKAIGDGG